MIYRNAKLKRTKRVTIVSIASISLIGGILLTSMGIGHLNNKRSNSINNIDIKPNELINNSVIAQEYTYRPLDELRQVKMDTYTTTFKDADGIKREYKFVEQADVLGLSKEFKCALEDYLKSFGASNWTNEGLEQFWPKDIEYVVTAIAYRESTYRTDIMNSLGCGGITCLKKSEVLKTLGEQWYVSHIWGSNIPDVNCTETEVDIFNPTVAIEYTYHYLGYNMANRFKKDKRFLDVDGVRRSIWDEIEFSEEMQTRLLIASYFWGIGNVTNSVFGRPNEKGEIVSINDYLYSDYVEDVLDKMQELKNTYEQGLGIN